MKPNEPFALSMHNPHIPTIGEANNLILGWRDRYGDTPTRARDRLRPKDIFDLGKGPGVKLSELDDLMMSREIKHIHRNGVTWLGWHWFNEALCGLNDEVVIRYTHSDLSQIYVYYKNVFLCAARPIQKVHPMASESENPKDMEELNRQRAEIRRIKRDVIKVCREGGPKVLERLPLKEIVYKIPNIDKDIEKIEAEKRTKFISSFVDEPVDSDSCIAPGETDKVDMAADHGSPLSCPYLKETWEIYEWYFVQDPEKLNIADLGFIDWYEDSYMGKDLQGESWQSYLKHLLAKRPGGSEDNGNDMDREDYRLGHDPAIERRWKQMKDTIIVDPESGLSRPAEEPPDEHIKYEFYRGIENRFPGTLTDRDWDEVKKYEANRNWEFVFKESEIYRLRRTVVTNLIEDDFDRTPTSHFEVKDEG
jgi:hypothetical protein